MIQSVQNMNAICYQIEIALGYQNMYLFLSGSLKDKRKKYIQLDYTLV